MGERWSSICGHYTIRSAVTSCVKLRHWCHVLWRSQVANQTSRTSPPHVTWLDRWTWSMIKGTRCQNLGDAVIYGYLEQSILAFTSYGDGRISRHLGHNIYLLLPYVHPIRDVSKFKMAANKLCITSFNTRSNRTLKFWKKTCVFEDLVLSEFCHYNIIHYTQLR